MRNQFDTENQNRMIVVRQQIDDTLRPFAGVIERRIPSFEGVALFYQDTYHPETAGTVAQINASTATDERLKFQNAHITNRRVDLGVSTLGQTFQYGDYQLAESAMNPEQHLVAGLHITEQTGKRAASVLQLAFAKEVGTPSSDELEMIHRYWEQFRPQYTPLLEALYAQSQTFPNKSVADALQLDTPTTPNAFAINWDTSGSREQAVGNYGNLRYELTLRGQRFLAIAEKHGAIYIQPTGDGQSFSLGIPPDQYDLLSDDSITLFAQETLYPLISELTTTAKQDNLDAPVRFAVELGCIEPTTLGASSPALFELADVSARLSHDRTALGFGRRAMHTLRLTDADIARLTA